MGKFNVETKMIMQIDHDLGVIEFDDGTRWVVSPGDRSVIVGWMPIDELSFRGSASAATLTYHDGHTTITALHQT